MMETVYLIGGSGFIGKHLARVLSKEYKITVFDKFIDRDYFNNYPDVDTYCLDLLHYAPPDCPSDNDTQHHMLLLHHLHAPCQAVAHRLKYQATYPFRLYRGAKSSFDYYRR